MKDKNKMLCYDEYLIVKLQRQGRRKEKATMTKLACNQLTG